MEISSLVILLLTLLAIPAAIVLAIILIVRRGFQMKNLAHHGVPSTGKILLIKQMGSPTHTPRNRPWRLRYTYTINGQTFENGISPSEAERQLPVGGPIDIVYLPSDPKISATRAMVNHSRAALKLPPL